MRPRDFRMGERLSQVRLGERNRLVTAERLRLGGRGDLPWYEGGAWSIISKQQVEQDAAGDNDFGCTKIPDEV